MMANSLIDILNSIFDYSGLPAEENAATTSVGTSSKPAKTSAGTGKAGGISGKIPKTQGQASPQVVEPAQQALYIEPKGDVFDTEDTKKTAFSEEDLSRMKKAGQGWNDWINSEEFKNLKTDGQSLDIAPEQAAIEAMFSKDEDSKDKKYVSPIQEILDQSNNSLSEEDLSRMKEAGQGWNNRTRSPLFASKTKEVAEAQKRRRQQERAGSGGSSEKQEDNLAKRSKATDAWSRRRGQDNLNSIYDEIANEFGITLSPDDYKLLRDRYDSPTLDDGSYSDPSLRKQLDTAEQYYQEMNKQNREQAIRTISLMANKAANEEARANRESNNIVASNLIPTFDPELSELEYQLNEASDFLGNAMTEEDIAAGKELVAKLTNDIETRKAFLDEQKQEAKSSYSDKLKQIDETTARLLGEIPEASTTSADSEGKAGEQPSSASSGARNNQSREFYDWLNTDSGKAFLDYWGKQGYDFSEANKGWSRMRTMNNADLWGDMYGLGDLSKYGLENFVTPEGWDVRLANSGIDATAEDAIDQLMKYMFVTNALRRSDLLQENPEWDRYGSLTGQDELIAYLIESGLMPYSDQLLGSWNSAGLDANDIAELYMASRLSQAGAGDSSTDELIDIINNSLANAGDAYRLGYLEEGGPFWAESRPNAQTYSPRMLYDESMPVSAYAYNEAGDTYDLIDWNILDTYYKLLSDAAEKEGKQIGFSTGKEVS